MVVSLLKRDVFLVSFFLSSSALSCLTIAWAMELPEENYTRTPIQQIQHKPCLVDALEAFEENQLEKAAPLFVQLRKAGAIVPLKYLEYMQQDCSPSLENLPEDGKKLSQAFFDASLAYKDYGTSKTNTQKEKNIQKLGTMVLNGNAHALTLFKKLYQKDKSILNYLKKASPIKKIKCADDVDKYYSPQKNEPIAFWNCLDPNNLFTFYKDNKDPEFAKGLKIFESKYKQDYRLIGNIALDLANCYPQQPIWAHLAVENGVNEACAPLGMFFYEVLQKNLKKCFNTNDKDFINMAPYYATQIQENCLTDQKTTTDYFCKNIIMSNLEEYEKKSDDIENIRYRLSLKIKADQGDKVEQNNYARLLHFGVCGPQNREAALKYHKLAADQGYADAQFQYAFMLHSGEECAQNLKTVLSYYKLAADQNHAEAQFSYATLLSKGEGVAQNLEEAFRYYKLAADQGHAGAQYRYALRCYLKSGSSEDMQEAFLYFKKASDQGHKEAIILQSYWRSVFLKETRAENQCDELRQGEQITELEDQASLKITLPLLAEEAESDEDDSETASMSEESLSPRANIPSDAILEPSSLGTIPQGEECLDEEKELTQELNQCAKKMAGEIGSLRAKKQAQKEAAARTRHTLTITNQSYNSTGTSQKIKAEICCKQKKHTVKPETLALVEAIFNPKRKINTFSNKDAQQAFANLGCSVGAKKGENSTLVSFVLAAGRVVKFKYHNPHEYGDDLYNALKPYMKQFLISINKTPATLKMGQENFLIMKDN